MRIKIIILAAGRGTRMGTELPKVLVEINGRAMIKYLIEAVKEANIDPSPIVVVSNENKEIISSALVDYNLSYAIQDQQLGTGHAVAAARELVPNDTERIIVLYGDHPFLKARSILNLAQAKNEGMTLAPTELGDFSGWHHNFWHWGRIIRGGDNGIEKIVEFKDASDKEKAITEVNPGFMAFNNKWLWNNIDKLKNDNKQQEYYLTDLVSLAFKDKQEISLVSIDPKEAMGINSAEELKIAETLNDF